MNAIARLITIPGGQLAFAWFVDAPIAGFEGLPVAEHRRAWRRFTFRPPFQLNRRTKQSLRVERAASSVGALDALSGGSHAA
jgi:hypothetical protein